MFGIRTIAMESSFFTTYVRQEFNSTTYQYETKTIDPLIPPKYRLLIYFAPGIISLLINLLRLFFTAKDLGGYLMKYPQFMVAPMFGPFMFEGYKQNESTQIRIWKWGTFINALCIGCLPQIVLIITEVYKGVPIWEFASTTLRAQSIYESNDALIKDPFVNIIFGIGSASLYGILILLFFSTKYLFSDRGIHCKCLYILCCPCPDPCINDSEPEPVTLTSENLSNERPLSPEEATVGEPNQSSQTHTNVYVYAKTRKMWIIGNDVDTRETFLMQVCFDISYIAAYIL